MSSNRPPTCLRLWSTRPETRGGVALVVALLSLVAATSGAPSRLIEALRVWERPLDPNSTALVALLGSPMLVVFGLVLEAVFSRATLRLDVKQGEVCFTSANRLRNGSVRVPLSRCSDRYPPRLAPGMREGEVANVLQLADTDVELARCETPAWAAELAGRGNAVLSSWARVAAAPPVSSTASAAEEVVERGYRHAPVRPQSRPGPTVMRIWHLTWVGRTFALLMAAFGCRFTCLATALMGDLRVDSPLRGGGASGPSYGGSAVVLAIAGLALAGVGLKLATARTTVRRDPAGRVAEFFRTGWLRGAHSTARIEVLQTVLHDRSALAEQIGPRYLSDLWGAPSREIHRRVTHFLRSVGESA